jgi:hypothetical protein
MNTDAATCTWDFQTCRCQHCDADAMTYARGAFLGLASFGWAVTFGVLAAFVSHREFARPPFPSRASDKHDSATERVLRAALGES